MGVGLGELTGNASVDVVANEHRHAWPPELAANELVCLEATWMAWNGCVVITLHDVASKHCVLGNVDLASKEDESVLLVPFLLTLGQRTGTTRENGL